MFDYLVRIHQLLTFHDIRGTFNKFPDIFVQAFKVVVDS